MGTRPLPTSHGRSSQGPLRLQVQTALLPQAGAFLKTDKAASRQSKNRRLSLSHHHGYQQGCRSPGVVAPRRPGGAAWLTTAALTSCLPQSETARQLHLGGRRGPDWSRNPGQPTSPGHLGPQSILGLERIHPKAGITWKGWSQTTCHVLRTLTPKVTELTQKTHQRKITQHFRGPQSCVDTGRFLPGHTPRPRPTPPPGAPTPPPGAPPCLPGHPLHLPASWGAHPASQGAQPALLCDGHRHTQGPGQQTGTPRTCRGPDLFITTRPSRLEVCGDRDPGQEQAIRGGPMLSIAFTSQSNRVRGRHP